MSMEANLIILASFSTPCSITTNPQSLLWLLPLAAMISIVYKAIKLPAITFGVFFKETAILFGSIMAFMVIIAVCLYIIAWVGS